MKLSIIFCVTTPDGMSYLAIDGANYYVKGVHNSIPVKFNSSRNAMACYIGTLHSAIEEYGDGCKAPDMFGAEVTISRTMEGG